MATTATTVANAAGAVLTRTLGGIWIGGVIGAAVFAGEKAAGWLAAASGWGTLGVWLLLPLYMAGAAAAVGYAGFWSGVRQAARVILLDNGWLRRVVERGLARARQAAAAPSEDEPPARGWAGARIAAFGHSLARVIIDRIGSAAAPEADTGAQVDQIAEELISDAGLVPSLIVLVVLGATFAIAPLVLA